MADHKMRARLIVHDFDTISDAERKDLITWLARTLHDLKTINQDTVSRRITYRLWKPGRHE